MAVTRFPNRLVVIVPAARKPGFVAWLGANLEGDWSGAFAPALVPAGGPAGAPATHYWASFSCTDDEATRLLARLTGQTNLTEPGQWDVWTRAQKKDWLDAVRAAVRGSIGVEVLGSFNDGAWADPGAALAALGLQRRIEAA